jgi:CDGSH-type Zn-finger protein
MAAVKITVRPNGPYRVEAPEGTVELVDVNGNKFDLTGKAAFSLCRCGGSVNKPFCDGTHSKIGFVGAELAVKKSDDDGITPAPNLSGPKI